MAEIQEEGLWICAAASVPVIWATLVRESLAGQGRLSRAVMTNAAMSQRAVTGALTARERMLPAFACALFPL